MRNSVIEGEILQGMKIRSVFLVWRGPLTDCLIDWVYDWLTEHTIDRLIDWSIHSLIIRPLWSPVTYSTYMHLCLWIQYAAVLVDEAFGPLGEFSARLFGPPVPQVSVRIKLAACSGNGPVSTCVSKGSDTSISRSHQAPFVWRLFVALIDNLTVNKSNGL